MKSTTVEEFQVSPLRDDTEYTEFAAKRQLMSIGDSEKKFLITGCTME